MRSRVLANIILATLERMAAGEGHAGVSIFDAGVAGGFDNGEVQIFLERSGLTFDRTTCDRAEFLDLLTAAIKLKPWHGEWHI
jgi:hypothetical protein